MRMLMALLVVMVLAAGGMLWAAEEGAVSKPIVMGDDVKVSIAVPEYGVVSQKGRFFVVIRNMTKQAIGIPTEGNSWGYGMLSFEVKGAGGESVIMKKKSRGWDKNSLSVTTLQPGEELVREINLDDKLWDNLPKLEAGDARAESHTFKMRAILDTQREGAGPVKYWKGSVDSGWREMKMVR